MSEEERFENLKGCEQLIFSSLMREYLEYMEGKSNKDAERMESARVRIRYYSAELLKE